MIEWSGNKNWVNGRATRGLWIVPPETSTNEVAGYVKAYKELTFLVVYNSGHFVPHN